MARRTDGLLFVTRAISEIERFRAFRAFRSSAPISIGFALPADYRRCKVRTAEPRARLLFTTAITHTPNRVRAVVAHQQRAVARYGDGNGSSPHMTRVADEARQEVFVLAGRRSVFQ